MLHARLLTGVDQDLAVIKTGEIVINAAAA
jgi:hypothetical protein